MGFGQKKIRYQLLRADNGFFKLKIMKKSGHYQPGASQGKENPYEDENKANKDDNGDRYHGNLLLMMIWNLNTSNNILLSRSYLT